MDKKKQDGEPMGRDLWVQQEAKKGFEYVFNDETQLDLKRAKEHSLVLVYHDSSRKIQSIDWVSNFSFMKRIFAAFQAKGKLECIKFILFEVEDTCETTIRYYDGSNKVCLNFLNKILGENSDKEKMTAEYMGIEKLIAQLQVLEINEIPSLPPRDDLFYSDDEPEYLQNDENDFSRMDHWIKFIEKKGARSLGVCQDTGRAFFGTAFLLLIEKSESKQQTKEQHGKYFKLFLELMKINASSANSIMFYILEKSNLNDALAQSHIVLKIHQYKKGVLVSDDYLKTQNIYSKVCLVSCSEPLEPILAKPRKVGVVKTSCPCSFWKRDEINRWHCKTCLAEIAYGFDDYIYCACGRGLGKDFTFKCTQPKHGIAFQKFPQEEILKTYLEELEPMKEINILLLGETGVGKSTFINALANYIQYDTLEEAEKFDLHHVIPASFTLTDHDYVERIIKVGDGSNECDSAGESSTQSCQSYKMTYKGDLVRIIDTPGIGDTRGSETDKANFENILGYLSNFETVRGICILLKPNQARLTVTFQYCIKELLCHLHKSASKNIVFIFTNARGTLYLPGDTLPALRELLKRNQNQSPFVELPLSKKTIYCFDSEAFRFLAAMKNGIEFNSGDRKNFSESWTRSVDEVDRLLSYVNCLEPHSVNDTITINGARRLIMNLPKPLGDISKIIQEKTKDAQEQKLQIITSYSQDVKKLKEALYDCSWEYEVVALTPPHIVCTSEKCYEIITIDGKQTKDYKNHCDKSKFLNFTIPYLTNNPSLALLGVFENGLCKKCGCSWRMHMRHFYKVKRQFHKKKNFAVEKDMHNAEDIYNAATEKLNELQSSMKELSDEQHFITLASAKFAYFLQKNAITPHNDTMKEYLDLMIKKEEEQPNISERQRSLIDVLKANRKYYEQEKKVLDDLAKNPGDLEKIDMTAKDVHDLVEKLTTLRRSGREFRKLKDSLDCNKKEEQDVTYDCSMILPNKKNTGSIFERLVNWVF